MKIPINITMTALTGLFLFTSCASSNFSNIKDLEAQYKNSEELVQENYPDDDGVILLREHYVDVSITTGASYYGLKTDERIHVVTKLFKNIDEYADFSIYLHEGENLKTISARTIKPDGTDQVLEQKDFYYSTGTSGNSVLYSDNKKVTFTFPSISKNCIIEVYFEISKDFPFVHDRWQMQFTLPVKKNIFELSAPIMLMVDEVQGGFGYTWRYKAFNYNALQEPSIRKPVNSSASSYDAKIVYSWVLEDVPAFKPEPMMPDWDLHRAYMKFSKGEWKTWNDVAKWYVDRFYTEVTDVTTEIRAKANEITSECKTEEEKIQKLFNYTQSLRYVAIDLDDGGLRPHKPTEVIKNSYGDCKDKSTLLLVLLKAIGISSDPVLVLTSDEGRIDPFFPSWGFNHMILKVKSNSEKTYWLDPTLEYSTINEIPWTVEGINVLVLNLPDKAIIERIPGSSSKDNLIKINQTVEYIDSDSTRFDVSIKYSGDDNFEKRIFFKEKTPKEIQEYIKGMVINDFGSFRVNSWSHSVLDSISQPFELKFSLITASAANRQGDLLLLNSDPTQLMNSMTWLKKDTRSYPIEFSQPYRIEKETRIKPVKNFAVRNLPENMSQETPFFYYKKSFSLDAKSGEIIALETYEVKSKTIVPSSYPQTKQFHERVKAKQTERIILNRL